MNEKEVLDMAIYNGDLSRGWRDYICGGVGCAGATDEAGQDGYVAGVLGYLDQIDELSKDAFAQVDDDCRCRDDGANRAAEIKEHIRQYVERAKSANREVLSRITREAWSDTIGLGGNHGG